MKTINKTISKKMKRVGSPKPEDRRKKKAIRFVWLLLPSSVSGLPTLNINY
jgi:hypothetical protein